MFDCQFCEIFKSSFFYKTPPVAGSVCGKATILSATTIRIENVVEVINNWFNDSQDFFNILIHCYDIVIIATIKEQLKKLPTTEK